VYAAYLITYDLKQFPMFYSALYEEIKKANKWWHYLPNSWIIITDQSILDWHKRLIPKTYQGDQILIIQVKHNSGGVLPKEAWDWINLNIPI
jgi:hypothetical protein